MKLKNKQTGEIGVLLSNPSKIDLCFVANDKGNYSYRTLAELNKEWEDASEEPEEPKEFYVVDLDGEILPSDFEDKTIEKSKELGNYFETKEEAEKAVEKLKIYSKLKQKGFGFSGWYRSAGRQLVIVADDHGFSETEPEDLTKLFGDKLC